MALKPTRFFQPEPLQSRKKKRILHQTRPLGKATGAVRRRKCVRRRRTAGRRAAKTARRGTSRLLLASGRLQQWVISCQARVDISAPAGAAGSCYLETRKTGLAALLIGRQALASPNARRRGRPRREGRKKRRRKLAGLTPPDAAKGRGPPPFEKPGAMPGACVGRAPCPMLA